MKQHLKRLSAAALAAILMATATGCSTQGNSDAHGTATAENSTAADGDFVRLKVWGFGYTATSDDMAAVSKAVSEITRDKIGVEVEIVRESDPEKLNLAMNSGEQWDLVNYHTFSGGLSALVANGMAAPIDDLVAEYGRDAVALVGEDMLRTGMVDGILYSIPSVNVYANGYGMAISQDILDELKIDPENLKTWDDIHEALLQMKEAHPDKYPVVTAWENGGMQKTFAFDNLGTGFWDALGVLENCSDSSTTVVNMYETDSYRELCERMYQWNQEGLLMPDATTTTTATKDLIGTVGYATFENIIPSKYQELASGSYWGGSKKGSAVQVVEPFVCSDAGGSSYFIPTVSEHKEEAMQLWNLMYTDKELCDILTYGIEGKDFDYTDDTHTTVHKLDSSTYDKNMTAWSWPNQSLAATVEGVDKDIWSQNKEFEAVAAVSPALGFKFDTSAVMNEITACSNVIAKYEPGLRWGELNPNETLPVFNKELYDAGLQTIIDEKQRQLDEFLGQ